MVCQAPQDGQRPSHFGESNPQLWQTKAVRVFLGFNVG
jgi:hypothetical protein